MTVQSDEGVYMVACDACGTELDTHREFQAAVDEAKRENWLFGRLNGEWTHHCRDCLDRANETPLQRAKRMFGKP